jgi:hypothetical protein
LHRHEVRLSAAELSAIAVGRTVTRQMSSHRLAICLACAAGHGQAARASDNAMARGRPGGA